MTPQIASLRIARTIGQAEGLADQYMMALAQLQIDLLTARAECDVPVHTGQRAIIRLVAAQQSLVRTQNDVFRVHDEISGIARERGIMDEEGITEGSGLSASDDLDRAA